MLFQLFGGPPSGPGSRHTYQSRCGASPAPRASTNHACSSLGWLGTRSSSTRMPRSRAAAISVSSVASEPRGGAGARADAALVGAVEAPVGVGRRERRFQPDAVDAEPCEVVEVVDDALQVA